MYVRRSDTYSEEMGQSDLSRRIAHGDSGYPVLTILNPFLSPRRLPQRRPIRSASLYLQCGVTRAGQDVDVPGRYRGDAIEHRINHSPVGASASSLAACRAQRSQRRRLANLLNPSAADY